MKLQVLQPAEPLLTVGWLLCGFTYSKILFKGTKIISHGIHVGIRK
uniref:Uncharacterized protein n=1 Tax=Arundo donax TaxID=35708 RepID=A0A0A9S9U3_ARUDO